MNKLKPWISVNGKPLNDGELKSISKSWSPEIWESYLQTLEHKENDSVISFMSSDTIEKTATEDFTSLVSDDSPLSDDFMQEIAGAVMSLPPQRKQIIFDSYWMNESASEMAKKRGVLRKNILKQKMKSKKELKNILENNSEHLAKWRSEK